MASAGVVFASCGASSSANGGGSGQTIDLAQWTSDVADGIPAGADMSLLINYDPSNDVLSAGDCTAAQPGLNALESDTSTWPTVLKTPMAAAELDLQNAINDCAAGQFTSMSSDVQSAESSITSAQNAFQADCNVTDNIETYSC